MDFINFKYMIREKTERRIGGECTVSVGNFIKNNGIELAGIRIDHAGSNASPIIYLNVYYAMYENGSSTLDEIVDDIIKKYSQNKIAGNTDTNKLFCYEEVKERIVYRLINKEKNGRLLKDIPYVEFYDLAVVFQVLVNDSDFGSAALLIRNEHLKIWNVSLCEIYENARKNTPILNGYELMHMGDVIKDYMPEEVNAYPFSLYVLSNRRGINGAVCVLYPGLIKNIAESMGSSLYIIPSSIHEMLLMPVADDDDDACNEAEIKRMVQEVNDGYVEAEDILSNSVYYYDRKKERIMML